MKLSYLMAFAATAAAATVQLRTIDELVDGYTWSEPTVEDNWIKDVADTRAPSSHHHYWNTVAPTGFTARTITANTLEVLDDAKWEASRSGNPLQWSPSQAGVFAWNPLDT